MKCFYFFGGHNKKDEPRFTKSLLVRSSASISNDREVRRSGSEFNSQRCGESLGRSTFPSMLQRPNNLRVFTMSDLKSATKNFSRSLMVGEGGFGCVYKGVIKSSGDQQIKQDVAVKQLDKRGFQGHKEWLTEVNVLGVVEHPSLVKLVGYCADDDERGIQRLLVYEYMPNKSVEDHLSAKTSTPLPWTTRLRIALDAARVLVYLHEEMDFQIIFRDLKTSNILLDEQWNAKLSGFGLAREGPSEGLTHVSTAVVGTIGYADPEYIQTGRLTSKSDVWSYGVVLYELITGRRPLDRNRPKSEQKLLEWIRPYLSDPKKFKQILDPRLQGNYSLSSAKKLAAVANRCLMRHPKSRPKMSEVLEMVKEIVEATEEVGNSELPMRSLNSEEVLEKDEPRTTKTLSVRSSASTSNDREVKRSGSEFNSQNVSDFSGESLGRSTFPSMSQRPNNLRVFTMSDLKSATKNFSRPLMVCEGGVGCVYKGVIKSSGDQQIKQEVTVKQLVKRGFQGNKEWVTEVNVLGMVEHPSLVKLVGYCADDNERGIQRLLVYEYMSNKSVEDHLSAKTSTPLPWTTRLRIALDAARGLAYLHEEMDFQIIFRDLKTSNILLDEQWNAKLSDFGLAREGPSEGLTHVSTVVLGTIGYAAPENIQTGRLTSKSDVWSYGVVLYELITGRRPLDRNRPKSEQKLLEWIRPYLSYPKKFKQILDPRLQGNYSLSSAKKLAAVADRCLVRHPKARPKMSEVLEMVKKIVEATTEEVGNIELLTRSLNSSNNSEADRNGSNLKRRMSDSKVTENGWSVWRSWTPKLVRTC